MSTSLVSALLCACVSLVQASRPGQADQVAAGEWTVDGQKRQALIISPSRPSKGGAPVLFVFHGHGGTMRLMARKGFQDHWPEAIIVCPQGVPTATPRDPQGRRSGWQMSPGASEDRDLKFVDAILQSLREKYEVDHGRVFATGHSNGGGFAYLLWRARGDRFAAIAPVAAGAPALLVAKDLAPLPVLHVAGEKDPIVRFANQERTMQWVRKLNRCDDQGKAWAQAGSMAGTLYRSERGAPLVAVTHPGGHEFPREAPGLIVRFFKEFGKRPVEVPTTAGSATRD